MTRLLPPARLLIPLILMLAFIVMLALARNASAQTSADPMTMLDAALEEPTRDVEIAVAILGKTGNADLDAREKLGNAAAEALMALDAVGEVPRCRLWFRAAWVAWTLLARSIEALTVADEATLALDGNLHDVAMEEFGIDVVGYSLLHTANALRLEVPCTPLAAKPSPSATPKPTPVAVKTRAP